MSLFQPVSWEWALLTEYILVFVFLSVPPTDVTVSHTTLTVNETDNVKVTCRVRYANPDPTFTWTKSGMVVRNMKDLNFSSISKGDAGSYKCSVNNTLDSAMANTHITVQCKYKVFFISKLCETMIYVITLVRSQFLLTYPNVIHKV